MHVIFVIGRVLVVLIFIIHGVGKLTDISGTAGPIAGKVPIPAPLADLAAQLQEASGMPMDQLIVAASGVLELAGGLLLAFGIATRAVSLVLFAYTLLVTYYLHNFWDMSGPERVSNIAYTEKNLALMGALLMLFAVGNWYAAWRRPNAGG